MTEREISLEQKAYEQLQSFLSDCNIENPQGKKLFEVGFWRGTFLNECQKAGLMSTGVEINKERFENAKKEFPHLDLLHYDGGKFPVPDNSFDFVVSFQVLEHVSSTEHIIKESLRVLKHGGIMYHVCPNYHSFYEGHYKILWLPFLNKKTARVYLKLLGRYSPLIEELNIIKPKHIIEVFNKYQNELEMISLGQKEFIRKFSPEQIDKIGHGFLRKCLKVLSICPIAIKCFLCIACWTKFYYPITVISRKKVLIPKEVKNPC